MKKNKKRNKLNKRLLGIIKIAEKLASVVSIIESLDKWRGFF